jgi:hypothetical protein
LILWADVKTAQDGKMGQRCNQKLGAVTKPTAPGTRCPRRLAAKFQFV